jgi:carboxyl-terminal processing protease
MATKEFVALLRNGHTGFDDDFLDRAGGPAVGFAALPTDGKWIVRQSAIDQLKIGDVVDTFDRVPMDRYFAQKRKYIAASSDAAAQHTFFYHRYLFPLQFKLRLGDGREVAVDRMTQKLTSPAPPRATGWLREPSIAYIRIPSFGEKRFEDAAIDALKKFQQADGVIFDVRDNGGGGTPTRLLEALVDRPYREWSQTSAFSVGLFGAYRQIPQILGTSEMTEYSRGYHDAFIEYFSRPQLLIPGILKLPHNPVYKGKIVVLTDFFCASACEDFVSPLKFSGRATIAGESTFGSSGQPYIYGFGNGMSLRIGAKRYYLADGSEFEGVGLKPDVEVKPTIDDLRKGEDVVLKRGIELLSAGR